MGMMNTINKLRFENQFLVKSLDQLKTEFSSLKGSLDKSRAASREPAPPAPSYQSELSQSAQHLLNFAKSLPVNYSIGSPALLLNSLQQISPAPSADSPPVMSVKRRRASDFDCGVCLKELCLCEEAGLKTSEVEVQFKDMAPMAAVPLARKRKPASETEIDFTASFGVKKMPDLKKLRKAVTENIAVKLEPHDPVVLFNEESSIENCGFCSDDTPCVCKEAAKDAARLSRSLQEAKYDQLQPQHETSTLLPPIMAPNILRKKSLPVMHPGPTVELREFTNLTPGAVPSVISDQRLQPQRERLDEEPSGCTGNPGTCSQCQTDPMSTLFCSTVASKAATEKSAERLPVPSRNDSKELLASSEPVFSAGNREATPVSTPIEEGATDKEGIFIPCADAYKTLLRHKRFNAVDFSSMVGRLTTRGMLVEAQSVANMLRELDKKVYD